MSADYAGQLRALKAQVDGKRSSMVEARAKVRMLEEREKEFFEELRSMGIQDPQALDALIAEAEASIDKELKQIAQILASVDANGQPVPEPEPEPAAPSQTLDALMGR